MKPIFWAVFLGLLAFAIPAGFNAGPISWLIGLIGGFAFYFIAGKNAK